MAESSRRVLEIEIPPEVVEKRAEQIAVQFQRRARLPGFRPGKAPMSLVKQRFRDDIRAELLQDLIPEYVHAQTQEHHWDPIGKPMVSDIEYAENSPIKFKATLEIFPEIVLQDLGGIEIEVKEPAVSDEEVAQALDHLRQDAATYINLDPRPIEDGDFASINVKEASAAEEPPSGKTRELLCEVGGEHTLKEFTENLRGAQVGEERSFSVSYPSDFNDPRLAGKTANYKVKILGLKSKQLPELNDDFAKELGEFDSLEKVRERIGEDILNSKKREAEEIAKNQVRQKLVQLHDIAVPEILVEHQIEKRMESVMRQIQSKGFNPQSLQLDWGKMRAAQREGAVEDVASSLILEKIAQENKLAVERADVEKEIQRISAVTGQPPEAVAALLTKDGGLDRIESRLRIEKALDFVLQNVRKMA